MAACKHVRQRYTVAVVYVPTRDVDEHILRVSKDETHQTHVIGQRRCEACHQVVSLGPANDAPPEVRVEIRAAEIAIGLQEGGCNVSPTEQSGFNDEPFRLRNGAVIRLDTDGQRAGYLAHCIVSHEGTPHAKAQ